jgi:ATP-dependent Clp protease protease subunit
MNKAFFAKKTGSRGEIYIYEDIGEGWFGGITAKAFSDSMKELGNVDALDIYINSPGGSVFDGVAIYNQIKRFAGEKIIHIDGIAASIASVIAMAGDEIRIAANGMIMIHDPWGMAVGTAGEMRKMADSLDKVRDTILTTYIAKTGKGEKQISDWMTAETWMNAEESVKNGFATKVTDEKAMKAEFPMLSKFNNVPEQLKKQSVASNALIARMEMRSKQLIRGASSGK